MGVVILDGSTLCAFVADHDAFARSVDARFDALDADGDGLLSRVELARALKSFRLLDGAGFGSSTQRPAPLIPAEVAALYDSVFQRLDAKHSGYVDRAGFRDEMRRIMLAVADGLGSHPLQVSIDNKTGSFLSEEAPEYKPIEYEAEEYEPIEYEPIEPEPPMEYEPIEYEPEEYEPIEPEPPMEYEPLEYEPVEHNSTAVAKIEAQRAAKCQGMPPIPPPS